VEGERALLKINRIASLVLITFLLCNLSSIVMAGAPKTISVIADKDNMFKIPGQKLPVITLKVNEVVHLRITANKSTEWDKDGTVHTFTINALKDQGWDLRLKEGTQDFTLVAPAEPGSYVVECTVKCGQGHDDMKMRLVVIP
jgi:heme/copper-type cytochrome/quinol oxidase subunit 2